MGPRSVLDIDGVNLILARTNPDQFSLPRAINQSRNEM
jgi:hypothetical protein